MYCPRASEPHPAARAPALRPPPAATAQHAARRGTAAGPGAREAAPAPCTRYVPICSAQSAGSPQRSSETPSDGSLCQRRVLVARQTAIAEHLTVKPRRTRTPTRRRVPRATRRVGADRTRLGSSASRLKIPVAGRPRSQAMAEHAALAATAPPTPSPADAEVLFARQPILDADCRLAGYELLYRGEGGSESPARGDLARRGLRAERPRPAPGHRRRARVPERHHRVPARDGPAAVRPRRRRPGDRRRPPARRPAARAPRPPAPARLHARPRRLRRPAVGRPAAGLRDARQGRPRNLEPVRPRADRLAPARPRHQADRQRRRRPHRPRPLRRRRLRALPGRLRLPPARGRRPQRPDRVDRRAAPRRRASAPATRATSTSWRRRSRWTRA